MDPIRNAPRTTIQAPDIESGVTPPPARPSRRRNYAIGGAVATAALGGIAAAVVLTSTHKHAAAPALAPAPAPTPTPAHAPRLAPPTPAPAPVRTSPAPAPTPIHTAPAPAPAPANTNITGFLAPQSGQAALPFTMFPKTAVYANQNVTGGSKFAIVLTDADENCQTLTAGPVRTSGIQEVDLCQVTNGSAITAQNGRIIKNGQQYSSVAMSLNGTVANNGLLAGHFTMNTTNAGYITGNFSAEHCQSLVFSNFCDLQN